MTARTTTVAVLTDAEVLMYRPDSGKYSRYEINAFSVQTLADLLEIAQQLKIDTIWVTPGCRVSQEARIMLNQAEGLEMRKSCKRDGTPRFLMMWRKESNKNSVKVGYPEHDSRWPFSKCSDPRVLIKTIVTLETALQSPVSWSPGHTGQAMMLQGAEKHPTWFAPCDIPGEVKDHLPIEMQWKRELSPDELAPGMWFHLFDKVAQYLGACTSALLGEGSPEYVFDEHGAIRFDPRTPGLWLADGQWVWTPRLEYLRAGQDDPSVISQAYVWKKAHNTLRAWAEDMWHGRVSLKDDEVFLPGLARDMAYDADKSIYTQSLGWLAMDSKLGDNKLYRPDWWSMVADTAYRNMGFKINQLKKLGLPPCYANVDALGLISEGPSLDKYQKYILNRQGQLGGFRHVGSVQMTKEMSTTFQDSTKFTYCQEAVNNAINEAKKGQPA